MTELTEFIIAACFILILATVVAVTMAIVLNEKGTNDSQKISNDSQEVSNDFESKLTKLIEFTKENPGLKYSITNN